MKPIVYLSSWLLLMTPPVYGLVIPNAKPGSAEFLIHACKEYTELYKKRDEPRFGAFLTTSKEESFRAGYCLGAIMHTNSTCAYTYGTSVYSAAEAIASFNVDHSLSEASLLEQAVCR